MMGTKNTCSRLKHRLSLQEEVTADDDAGGFTRSWVEVAVLWGEMEPITSGDSRLNTSAGKEIFASGQVQAVISHRIFIRWREGVTPAMRLVFENRAFNIRYVAALHEQRELMELQVQEGVAD